jgi:hypothetical protein
LWDIVPPHHAPVASGKDLASSRPTLTPRHVFGGYRADAPRVFVAPGFNPSLESPVQSSTFTDPEAPTPSGDGASTSKVAELGQRAAAAIDSKRESLASGMESAASKLRDQADRLPGGERLADPARRAAGAMESTADYLRDRDARGMVEDAGAIVARHPGAALLTAAAVGFLLARALTRD